MSAGGLMLISELDDRHGQGKLIHQYSAGSREKNTHYCVVDLL